MKPDKILQLLSLSQRAGKVESGEFKTEEAVRSGKAHLVVIAGDASQRTKKQFKDMCSYRDVPVLIYSDKESLGHQLGKEYRALLAVTDKGLADKILETVTGSETEVNK